MGRLRAARLLPDFLPRLTGRYRQLQRRCCDAVTGAINATSLSGTAGPLASSASREKVAFCACRPGDHRDRALVLVW
jgi:hypothetical protein